MMFCVHLIEAGIVTKNDNYTMFKTPIKISWLVFKQEEVKYNQVNEVEIILHWDASAFL